MSNRIYTEQELLTKNRTELVVIITQIAALKNVDFTDISPPNARIELMIDSILEAQEQVGGS